MREGHKGIVAGMTTGSDRSGESLAEILIVMNV
jgi:hypothetical protein